jgi:hypothetical protein
MEPLYTRPSNGVSHVYTEALHPRNSDGKWRTAYNKVTRPPVRGPRRLVRVNPINRGRQVQTTRRRNWAPIPWGKRTWFGKAVGLVNGDWRRWRKSELRKKAKQDSKQRGMR